MRTSRDLQRSSDTAEPFKPGSVPSRNGELLHELTVDEAYLLASKILVLSCSTDPTFQFDLHCSGAATVPTLYCNYNWWTSAIPYRPRPISTGEGDCSELSPCSELFPRVET